MAIELVGANPGLTLLDHAGERIAYASVWQVSWSTHGPGRALVLWHDGRTRVVSEQPDLAAWLAESFVRHFPEVDGLTWPTPTVEDAPVSWHLDLATGFRAAAADVVVTLEGPLDHRVAATDSFALGGVTRGFSTVFVPCRSGHLEIAGAQVPGAPAVDADARTSTAFIADAEVWTDGV